MTTERKRIAAVILAAMETKQMRPGDVNIAMGVDRSSPAIYNWMNAKSMPNSASREKLQEALGITFEPALQAQVNSVPTYSINRLLNMLRAEAKRMGITSMTFTIGD